MDNDNKFWLILWSIVATVITIIITSIAINNYLDHREVVYQASKGLQPYKVSQCSHYNTYTEWHEAGWKPTTQQ